jgi:hypothetical protein
LGAGFYRPSNLMSFGCSAGPYETHSMNEQTKFGISPRIGFDHKHFTMSLEYNLVVNSGATIYNDAPPSDIQYIAPHTEYFRNDYLSLHIGFFLGGGSKATNN